MKAVIPVLREIVAHGDDEEAPPKRHPAEYILETRQSEWKQLESEIGHERPEHDQRKSKAHNIGELFVAVPMVAVVQARNEL